MSIQFVPSRVEGLSGVTQVTIFPDRIELVTSRSRITHHFKEIARWPTPASLFKFLYRFGIKPRWLPVADRDWFHAPSDMFFEFYTAPPLKIYMPEDENKDSYANSYFARIQAVLAEAGFHTNDLG